MKKIIIVFTVGLFCLSISGQEVGLQLYSLRNQFPDDVPGTFAQIKEWGIHYLEDGNDGDLWLCDGRV